jgi:hypothetical protein
MVPAQTNNITFNSNVIKASIQKTCTFGNNGKSSGEQ